VQRQTAGLLVAEENGAHELEGIGTPVRLGLWRSSAIRKVFDRLGEARDVRANQRCFPNSGYRRYFRSLPRERQVSVDGEVPSGRTYLVHEGIVELDGEDAPTLLRAGYQTIG
jgi:hypothetical protein